MNQATDDAIPLVLIADDEASLRLLVSASLAARDLRVVEAVDGDQAWQMLQEHRPNLALLDVQMPGLSGLDLTRAIRGDPNLAGTKVILITSKAQEADIADGLDAGADRYLTKPFSPLELEVIVRQALGLS